MGDMHRGAKIGPRIAHVVSQSLVATHQGLLSTRHKLAMAVFHSASDEISEEVQQVLGPILRMLLEDPDLDPAMRPHLEFMAYQHGQLNALAGVTLTASGVLSSLALIMNNLLGPAVQRAVAATPNLIPDAGTIAAIVAKGADTWDGTRWAFRSNGINDSWAHDLIEASYSYPDMATALEMYRRGLIPRDELHKYLTRSGIPGTVVPNVAALSDVPLSPADAALAVLRGNMSQTDGERVAAHNGVSAGDFNVLIGNTGEPPGLMQMLEAYRRGFINEGQLDSGIRESRVRNEWIPTIKQLRYAPMSVSDAVRAVVQNQMPASEGRRIADENGLKAGHFDILESTAGEPLSRTEMEQLYNRGLVSQSEVEQAVRESRTKNKYVSLAFELHRRIIPARTLAVALRNGSITHDRAIRAAMDDGYSAQDAAVMVSSGTTDKLSKYRDKVMTAVDTMYKDGALERDRASNLIQGMGHSEQEASFILQAADLEAAAHLVSQGISAIRSKYISRHIDEHTASVDLTSLGVVATHRDNLIHIWNIERSANVRTLTSAQIVKGHKLQLLSDDDALNRLTGLGYSPTDAALLLAGA